MRIVRTYVAQNAFAATMSAMRLWLDKNGNPDVRCETAKDEAGILISLEFRQDAAAHAFARQFGNAPLSSPMLAA
jgi:hypothetical protein